MERLQQITDSNHPLTGNIQDLYVASFPENERRPWSSITEMIDSKSPFFTMNAILNDDDSFAGFITLWTLPDTRYVEHFAIRREQRGNGSGARIISEVVNRAEGTPVVLEVELPGDSPEADRRIGFYKRNGF